MDRSSRRSALATPACMATALLALALLCSATLAEGARGATAARHARRRLALSSHPRQHYRRLQANTSSLCVSVTPGAPAPYQVAQATCLELYRPPATAIHAPADTATVKWGQILGLSSPFLFYDRDNKFYTISEAAKPPTDAREVANVWSRILVKAKLDAKGVVISIAPALYVPSSTVLRTFQGAVYEGVVQNGPFKPGQEPKGVNATSYIRWSFFSNFTSDGQLPGSFDNLYHAVRDTNGTCRPALCADPTRRSPACEYYSKLFNSTIHLTWDASIYYPGVSGSQLGVFLSQTTYVPTYLPPLYQLPIKAWEYVPAQYAFNVGNPFNLPFQISGAVAKPADNSTTVPLC